MLSFSTASQISLRGTLTSAASSQWPLITSYFSADGIIKVKMNPQPRQAAVPALKAFNNFLSVLFLL